MNKKAKMGRQMAFLFLTDHSQNTEKSEHFIFVLGDLVQNLQYFWFEQSEIERD